MSGRGVFWVVYLGLVIGGFALAPWYAGVVYLVAVPVTFGFLWWDTRRWPQDGAR